MKVPLRFQITEFDCGTVSLQNAFSYLFDREEIPVELVKAIQRYTLDSYDEFGNLGQGGTSKEAVKKITHWITRYANKNNFNVNCCRLESEQVNLDNLMHCLDNHGVIFIRCWQGCEHYVIITKISKRWVYIFDPYYLNRNEYNKDRNIKIVLNKPFTYNRKVKLKRVFSETKKDFSLGIIKNRECVLINRV